MRTGPSGGSGRPVTGIRSALSRCVGVGSEEFATRYWGREPLFSCADELPNAAGFTDLLSPADADELLSCRGLRAPFLRVARDGALVPTGRYTGGGGAGAEITDQILDERILGLYAQGATLVLQGLHRNWPPLIGFAGDLTDVLRQPVQINAYLTPAGNQGFATHYDTHDVIVLQVDGCKRWRIHRPVLPDPLERQSWGGRADEVEATADGPPALELTLQPGDALYLPRGWLHSAQAQLDSSMHLTVGIRALTRYALVEALLGLAAEDQWLRGTLPFGIDLTDPAQLACELDATVGALRDWLVTADRTGVANRLRERTWSSTRPAPIRPLAQAAAINALDVDSRFSLRPGLRWQLDGPGDPAPRPGADGFAEADGASTAAMADRVELRLPDRTITFPAGCAEALRALLKGKVRRVGDLPGLGDDADRLLLARRLLREAVVVPG